MCAIMEKFLMCLLVHVSSNSGCAEPVNWRFAESAIVARFLLNNDDGNDDDDDDAVSLWSV